MCGIAGWINFRENLSDRTSVIENMTDTLKLRGPDSCGFYISENVLFGHRRLIVVDPEGGAQPMIKKLGEREYILIYNGELYNTDELRSELETHGFTFDSYSDTEVLLNAYIYWGAECVHKLNGIFAFAVFDKKRREVFLARDPLGVKPLFYTIKGRSLIFGSELKTLFAHPLVKPVIDRDGLTELFALGPASPPGSGTYKGIKEVPPAHYLTFSLEKTTLYEYWKPQVAEFTETEDEAAEHLRVLFTDAVKRQLVGDVPLCTFLSGGLDSSAISAIAAEEYKKRGLVLSTYSIDYEDNDKYFKTSLFQPTSDEHWARVMATEIGSNHTSVFINQTELAKKLEQAVYAKDLPGMADIDSSLFIFCREVRKKFVIALSGECADEILGGYPWYTNTEMIFSDTFPWSRSVEQRKTILADNLKDLKIAECTKQHYSDTLRQVPHLDHESTLDYRMRELFYLNIKWFMVNLLNRKDRMSMSNSLEVRVPFADYRLVEYAFNIPQKIKFADGREKGLLRRALSGLLPDEIVNRKKSPYPKTHNPMYTSLVCAQMSSILENKNSPLLEIVSRDKLLELIETRGEAYKTPWFGQLMTGPQLIAYLVQMNIWLKSYNIRLEI